MAKDILSKFETLVRKLNYSQIKLATLDLEKVKKWTKQRMPGVVQELEDLDWDLSNDKTWSETVFVNTCLKWYGKNVALYLTSSMLDYKLATKVLKYPAFRDFRKSFNIDVHGIVLLNPVIFLIPEDLDSLYINFDFEKGYSLIDFSHFDEEDELEPEYVNDWEWLSAEEGDPIEWSSLQIKQALPKI